MRAIRANYVQYGCGWCAPEGWISFDNSPTLRYERLAILGRFHRKNPERFPDNVFYGDIVKGLPVENGCVTGLYCSHVLEHLSLSDCRLALQSSRLLLSEKGVFRLVTPDLEWLASKYLEKLHEGDSEASSWLMERSGFGKQKRCKGFWQFMMKWLGGAEHLWLWDEASLSTELARAGFRSVRRCVMGDASDPAFLAVEEPKRFRHCLAVEARP